MLSTRSTSAFLCLAKSGSFQAAALELGVSNATLTRYIQTAEAEAGFALFDRKRGNNELTIKGRELFPLVEELASNVQIFATKARQIQLGEQGVLRIGCGPLTTRTLVRPTFQEVLKEIPEIRCEIIVKAAVQPLKLLARGYIDIFVGDLTHTPDAKDTELEIQMLKRRPVIFVAASDHAIHRNGPATLKDILQFPFASPHLHRHWRASLEAALGGDAAAVEKVQKLPQVTTDDYATITDLMYNSDFVSGGMRETFSEPLALGLLKEIKMHATLEWNICVARRRENDNPTTDVFWKKLCAKFGAPHFQTTSS